ncbi:MAG: hypothetical protein R3B09_33405 [Nannocystaceae bacterium]
MIAPGAFFVVHKGQAPDQHAFGLSGDGDSVALLRPDRAIVDQVTYGAAEAKASYCRLPDGPGGQWTSGCAPTQGAPNQGG